jgi:GT2 family glycosyltransferase
VSWNVRELLIRCLRSLENSPRLEILSADGSLHGADGAHYTAEVIVVDNASTDGSASAIAAGFPWVTLLANDENIGFTRGNNQGLVVSSGRTVLFLNPDTEVIGEALPTMLDFMAAHPEVGALGPELRYADGSIQSSRRCFPTLMTGFFESTPLAWHWPQNRWARRYRMEGEAERSAGPVDWVVGAALLARREALDQIGGFDEAYFMYSEELDWCRRAKDAGWEVVFLPSAQIVHHEGKSSEQVAAARHIYFQTSKVRYFRKFHGPLASETLRLGLLGMFAGEWALEGLKGLLGHKQALRRQRMAAYEKLLRSGLRPQKTGS